VDPVSYFDYKKDYSVHLQAVCDSKTRVLFYHIGAQQHQQDNPHLRSPAQLPPDQG
jgi:hypothetical protein